MKALFFSIFMILALAIIKPESKDHKSHLYCDCDFYEDSSYVKTYFNNKESLELFRKSNYDYHILYIKNCSGQSSETLIEIFTKGSQLRFHKRTSNLLYSNILKLNSQEYFQSVIDEIDRKELYNYFCSGIFGGCDKLLLVKKEGNLLMKYNSNSDIEQASEREQNLLLKTKKILDAVQKLDRKISHFPLK